MPSASLIYQIFNVRPVYTTEWLPYLAMPIFHDAGSAAMQAMADTTNASKDPTKPSAEVLEHKAKALANIRSEIIFKNVDDVILMGILFLAVVEKRFGNQKEFIMHRQTLGKLVDARGGLKSIGEYIRCVLLQFEFFWAWSSGFSVFSLDDLETGEDCETWSPTSWKMISELPEGFQWLAMEQKLPLKLVEAIYRVVLAKRAQLERYKTRRVYQNFWEAVPIRAIANGKEPYLEKLLCLTLTLYTTFSSVRPILNSQAVWARSELTQRLPECKNDRGQAEEQCLFWIWTAAVASWRDASGVMSRSGRRLMELQRTRFSEIFSTNMAVPTLELFFCDESLLDVVVTAV